MKRINFVGSGAVSICLCAGLPVSALAAPPPPTPAVADSSSSTKGAINPQQPAHACLSDLRAFDTHMEGGGYWLGESQIGYGYPAADTAFEMVNPRSTVGDGTGHTAALTKPANSFTDARPGYEVRTLIAAADILAKNGQQHSCESVLSTAKVIYRTYASQIHDMDVGLVDQNTWQEHDIAAAQPVNAINTPLWSNRLLDSEVHNTQGVALGSVDDLVLNPENGKYLYVVLARGELLPVWWTRG